MKLKSDLRTDFYIWAISAVSLAFALVVFPNGCVRQEMGITGSPARYCRDEVVILPPGRFPTEEICRSDQVLIFNARGFMRCVCDVHPDGGKPMFYEYPAEDEEEEDKIEGLPGSSGYRDTEL